MELLLFGKVMVSLGLFLCVFGVLLSILKMFYIQNNNQGVFEKILETSRLVKEINATVTDMNMEILREYKLYYSIKVTKIGIGLLAIGIFALIILLVYKIIF